MTRNPDLSDQFGRAWLFPVEQLRARMQSNDATVCCWLTHAPASHPFWPWHFFVIVHLRCGPGLPEPIRHSLSATHELMVFAIDPERCPEPDPDGGPWPFLDPPDIVEQFELRNDGDASRIGRLIAKSITNGVLVPDCDHRRNWRRLVQATAAHIREGKHDAQ